MPSTPAAWILAASAAASTPLTGNLPRHRPRTRTIFGSVLRSDSKLESRFKKNGNQRLRFDSPPLLTYARHLHQPQKKIKYGIFD